MAIYTIEIIRGEGVYFSMPHLRWTERMVADFRREEAPRLIADGLRLRVSQAPAPHVRATTYAKWEKVDALP